MPRQPSRVPAKERFITLLCAAIDDGSLVKLTLSRPVTQDPTLKNVFARPIVLKAGQRLSFVYRHTTKDITRNATHQEAVARVQTMLGHDFLSAHLFTTSQSAQLELHPKSKPRLVLGKPKHKDVASTQHDRAKPRTISIEGAPWLQALGVTTAGGAVSRGMEPKLRQIHRFIELLEPLLAGCQANPDRHKQALTIVDVGSGKGYLTFATYAYLLQTSAAQPTVRGVERRTDLVTLCNRVARENNFGGLSFETGDIASANLRDIDVLIALHACDTATDDAIAQGIRAGASLILVAPCCHKELRPQIKAPPELATALKHGILLQRHSELVTDALRAALLEWAGYDARVFEFISTEHTAKNLMIAATKQQKPAPNAVVQQRARHVRDLAAFHGIEQQRTATQLGCTKISQLGCTKISQLGYSNA